MYLFEDVLFSQQFLSLSVRFGDRDFQRVLSGVFLVGTEADAFTQQLCH